MPRRPLFRIALAAAAALMLDAGTARSELPGEPDPTFNGGQPLVRNFALSSPGGTTFAGSTVDAQGRILVTGTTTDEEGRGALLLVRFGPTGAVDTSFGDGGAVITVLGLGSPPYAPQSVGWAVGSRPGGGYLVAGTASVAVDPTILSRGALVTAFDDNGMIDIAFGTGGSARPNPVTAGVLSGSAGAVAPDGTVYVSGGVTVEQPVFDQRLFVSKVTPAGLADMSFGNIAPGSYLNNFPEGTQQSSGSGDVTVTPAGVLVCGTTTDVNNGGQLLVLRLTTSGTLDPDFGGGTGYFRKQVGTPRPGEFPVSQGGAIAAGPDGEIYAAGRAEDSNGQFAMSLTRLTPAGAIDGTFANLGTRVLQVSTDPGGTSAVTDLVVQPDGRPVVVGVVTGAMFAAPKGVVARFDVSGNLDPTFGSNGVVLLGYNPQTSASGVALSPDAQSVIVTGSTYPEGQPAHGFVTRLLLAPVTTTTTLPGTGCAAAPSLPGALCRVAALAAALDAAAPAGKLEKKLLRCTSGAEGQLSAAGSATGTAQRRKLKKALRQLLKLAQRLGSKAATRDIAAETRTILAADTDALASEIETLLSSAS